MGYQHRKKDPSADSIMKRTNFQNDSAMTYEKFQIAVPDRPLTNWEKAELRVHCESLGVTYPDAPNFEVFMKIVGRGPEYYSDEKKVWVTPELGKAV